MRIALLQILPGHTPDENFNIATAWIEKAATQGADVALLPELWTIGYASPESYAEGKEAWQSAALTPEDSDFKRYRDLAREHKIALLLPYLERVDDEYADSAALIDREGTVILNYRKVHTVDKAWEIILYAGNDFPVAELVTKDEIVQIGCMICYDREFPEAARILMLHGAEIILIPNACGIDKNRIAQLQTRGFENMLAVAMTNYPAPKNNGRSAVFNGMREKGNDNYDSTLALMDDKEGVVFADIDLARLRAYRETDIWGDAYRRPRVYGELTVDTPRPPFVRSNARR